jgi:hypothetical protein
MVRTLLAAALAFGLVGFAAPDASAAKAKAKKADKTQVLTGTVKSIDAAKSLLVVSQTVKKQKVDRELTIGSATTFSVKDGDKTKELTGKEGLALLKGKEGTTVAVKSGKDSKAVSVTVTEPAAKKKKAKKAK